MKLSRHLPLALGLTAVLAAGCKPHGETRAPGASALPVASVRVQRVEAKMCPATEETVGTVRAKLQARLEAKIPGRIDVMQAEPGQKVKAGDLLAHLDAEEIRAKLDQALAVEQQAVGDLKRYQKLLETAAATQAEFDAVQARERVAAGAVKEAQTMLGYADVAAPFDGVVTRKLADVGDLAIPGKPLLDLEDPSHLRFETDIPEAIIDRVALGAVMSVQVPNVAGALAAAVSEIAPAADPNTRTFRVKLDLPAAAGLRAGQFGRVAVPLAERMALRVPASAVVRRGQMELVFVVVNGHAQLRLVKTGKRIGDELELVSGVDAGEQVVRDDAGQLVDGQPVTVK